MNKNKIRKTFTLDEEVYNKFQLYAITIGRSVSSLIEQYLREILKGIEKENK